MDSKFFLNSKAIIGALISILGPTITLTMGGVDWNSETGVITINVYQLLGLGGAPVLGGLFAFVGRAVAKSDIRFTL